MFHHVITYIYFKRVLQFQLLRDRIKWQKWNYEWPDVETLGNGGRFRTDGDRRTIRWRADFISTSDYATCRLLLFAWQARLHILVLFTQVIYSM